MVKVTFSKKSQNQQLGMDMNMGGYLITLGCKQSKLSLEKGYNEYYLSTNSRPLVIPKYGNKGVWGMDGWCVVAQNLHLW